MYSEGLQFIVRYKLTNEKNKMETKNYKVEHSTWTRHNQTLAPINQPTTMPTIAPPIPQTIGTITSKPMERVSFVQINEYTIAFQTNCLYTEEGQIFICRKVGHCVIFYDVCRKIDGTIPNCTLSQSAIRRAYDNGNYESSLGWELRESLLKQLSPYRRSLKTTR